jgi:hypothetical protein
VKILMTFQNAVKLFTVFAFLAGLMSPRSASAQAVPYARTFSASKEDVDKALKDLQAYTGQKLPTVDGFVATGDQSLDRFERAFYQFSVDVLPGGSKDTVVRLTAKITAWYADRDPAKSGYQVLASNGRLELDLLDRLAEKLGDHSSAPVSRTGPSAPRPKLDLSTGLSGNGLPVTRSTIPAASPAAPGSVASQSDEITALRVRSLTEENRMQQLNSELQGLQEIQRNQAHPLNLVVVKKSGTPVLARPAEGSRVLFAASADDEFEFLNAEGEWIHVQISGASRGYIRLNNLDLPELIATRIRSPNANSPIERPGAFRVTHEETATFPGDWEILHGKTVKIYTVQPLSQDPKETGAAAKLNFAANLFQKFTADAANSTPGVAGVAIIFDSADGGILAATVADLQQLANGSLSPEKLWKQCYMEPREAFLPPWK